MSMIGNLLAVTQEELDDLYDNPHEISDFIYEKRYEEAVDLDKTWQAIHFTLTGELYGGDSVLSHAIFGDKPIGNEDVGYGAALGNSAQLVQQISTELLTITDRIFCAKFNPLALQKADVYPHIWEEWEEEDMLDGYILTNFQLMKDFYTEAASNNKAAITFIN